MKQPILTFAFLFLFLLSKPALAQDVERGQQLFRTCMACHTLEPGRAKVGPTLYGLFGRPAASVDGYRYSPDMLAYGEEGGVWDEESLDAFLKAPRSIARRTKMGFPGMRSDEDRVNLIAYLKEATKPSED